MSQTSEEFIKVIEPIILECLDDAFSTYEYMLTEGNAAQFEQAEYDYEKWNRAHMALLKAKGELND